MAEVRITEKQQEILQYIEESVAKMGYPPSVREIGQAVRLKSTASVHDHLQALEDQGFIRRNSAKPRAITVIGRGHTSADPAPTAPTVPNADGCSTALDGIQPGCMASLFRVTGGMAGAGITDGDWVAVQPGGVKTGEAAALRIGDTVTVRLFRHTDVQRQLRPGDTVRVQDGGGTEQAQILGRVIGLLHMI